MEKIQDELNLIKQSQLSGNDLLVVSRCESLNDQTPLGKIFYFVGRYNLILWLIFVGLSLVFFGKFEFFNSKGFRYIYPFIFIFIFFAHDFYYWVLIKKLAYRIKHLENKLGKIKEATK